MSKTSAVQYLVGVRGVTGHEHVDAILKHLEDRGVYRSAEMEYRPEEQALCLSFDAGDFANRGVDFIMTVAFMSGVVPSYVCRAVYLSNRSTEIRSYHREPDGRRYCYTPRHKRYLDPEHPAEVVQAA